MRCNWRGLREKVEALLADAETKRLWLLVDAGQVQCRLVVVKRESERWS